MAERVLTLREAVSLAAVISIAQRGARVRWDEPTTHDLIEGTARSIGDEAGNFLGRGEDVRDAFLRVTTSAGWERFLPMAQVVELHGLGLFVED